jgi:hypothetical protein
MLALALLALGLSACGGVSSPFGKDLPAADRVGTLEVELAQARGTAAVEAGGQAAANATPASSVEADFSTSTEAFALGENARIADGALLVGPYDQCANDVPNFNEPVDCMVVCTECGSRVREYQMDIDFTFEEGLSEREFGVILRFVDEDQDNLLDPEDYLLAVGFDFFDNLWSLYLHEPDQTDPWRQLISDEAGFLTAGRLNRLEVETRRDGELLQVYLNDARILNMTGQAPEPGEFLIEPWAESGAVGVLALGRRVTGRFDNFSFSPR